MAYILRMTPRSPRTTARRALPAATLAIGAAVAAVATCAPAMGAGAPSMLFSQSGGEATARQVSARTVDLTLRTAHKAVLAFEDRPGRRTATLAEHKFLGLWQGSFRADPPNAILTGRDSLGRNRRVVGVITRAARTPGGVRYRMRVLRGTVPERLTMANLTVDDVPLSAVTAYLARQGARAQQYQALINALRFPMYVQPAAADTMTVPPGATATLGQAASAAPTIITLGTLTVAPGATLVVQGVTSIRAQQLTMGPGSRIVMPGSPGLFSLTASRLPVCAPPSDLTVVGTLTQVRSMLPPLGLITQALLPVPVTTQAWPAAGVSASGAPGGCVVTWAFNPPPVVAPVPVPPQFPGMSATIVTQSTTQQEVAVAGPGPFAPGAVVITVHSAGAPAA
jgi:hypothetical protein